MRREHERDGDHFVDQFSEASFIMSVMLLILTLLDGLLTLVLLDLGCEEINPIMRYLIERGWVPFLVAKYLLTASSLPFLLILQNHRMFRSPVRIRCLIPVFVALYLALLSYQVEILSHVDSRSAALGPVLPSIRHRGP